MYKGIEKKREDNKGDKNDRSRGRPSKRRKKLQRRKSGEEG